MAILFKAYHRQFLSLQCPLPQGLGTAGAHPYLVHRCQLGKGISWCHTLFVSMHMDFITNTH